MDLNLAEGESVGTLRVVADVGGRSWEGCIGATGAGREVFFDFAGQRGRDTREGSNLVVWRSWAKDGGETGHGAICWP